MTTLETRRSKHYQGTALRILIGKLFIPELCHVEDTPSHNGINIFNTTLRRLTPNVIPLEAAEIAANGHEVENDLDFYLYRDQKIYRRIFKDHIFVDFLACSIDGVSINLDRAEPPPLRYRANLLEPCIPYDDGLEQILNMCLEACVGFKYQPAAM